MRIHTYIILLAMALFPITAKSQLKNDLEKEGLKGPVSTVQLELYQGKMEGGTVREGRPIGFYVTDYNETGFRTQERSGHFIDKWEYDAKGYKTKVTRLHLDGTIQQDRIFENDSKGRCLADRCVNSLGELINKRVFEYDDQENKITRKQVFPTSPREVRVSFYDNKQNLIREDIYFPQPSELRQRTLFRYNSLGQKMEERTMSDISTLLYNQQGDVTNITYSDGTRTSVVKYVYKYDSRDNWIEKHELIDGKAGNFYIRQISYRDSH
ncbi:hypothetical protein FUAX_29600 [Fulvitalea axinellae]|uniref:YD repeat-containing protein n=1 Tax=Fulvitalea axinellae TaxID=1182444 RepID=A0AAU9CK31_9BACT|nr:hypothetical protein FUAX_29600 [Fulvitalea axinellae]